MKDILQNLNKAQYDAVVSTDGPKLILAGAGSGKTRVITTKIAYLIEEKNVNPNEILAFTFTNKAANEMKTRVSELLKRNIDYMWIGTFHSICVRILRRDIDLDGYNSNFTIFDTTDQKTLLKDCINELNLDTKIYSPKFAQSEISSLKNYGITPDEFRKTAYSLTDKNLANIYAKYEKKMVQNNAMDFDDLIINTINLLNKNEQVRQYYQERFRYVFVDEYQDTNKIQYNLINILGNKYKNVNVVGDADQSIYKWRGADITNILNFERDYSDSQKIILSQNYRSTQKILDSANKIISNNTERIKKDLWTDNKTGTAPKVYEAENSYEEAEFVVDKIEQMLDKKEKSPKDISILYRSNSISRSFEEQLIKRGISYKVVGGIKFYDRAEIKDIIAYLRLVSNFDDDVSFRRIVNSPKRGIAEVTIGKLEQISRDKNVSLYNAIRYIDEYNLFNMRAKDNLNEFYELIDNMNLKSKSINISELVEFLLDRTEYIKVLEKNNNIESRSKIENIYEFINSVKTYEDNNDSDLNNFLSDISLLSDVDKTENIEDSVSLMTVHSAKGLEFDTVFVVALEEGIFPSGYAESDEDIEEERRLMYVAITRAMNELYLTCSKNRMLYGKDQARMKSSFLDELDTTVEYIKNTDKKIFTPKEKSVGKRYFKNTFEPDKFYASEKVSINDNKFIAGQRIKHSKWGTGTITEIKHSGGDELVTVNFDDGQTKVLLSSMAPMEVING